MNAVEIYRGAESDLEHNRITLGEFDERIKPLMDVEQVVRCKDCKHYKPHKLFQCDLHGAYQQRQDFFCADGERK